MSCRIYVGRLPRKATENDVERFFRGYGRIRDIELKGDFGFVELENAHDADDAAYDLNGKELCGSRVIVELARLPGSRPGFTKNRNTRDPRSSLNDQEDQVDAGLHGQRSLHILPDSWIFMDLKDVMRKAGEVTYADAHKLKKNEAIVEFASRSDLKRAVERFEGYELNGRKLRLVEEGASSRSPSPRGRKRSNRRDSYDRSPSDKRRRSISNNRRSKSSPYSSGGSHGPSGRREEPFKSNRRSRSNSSGDEKSPKEKGDRREASVPKSLSSREHSIGSDRSAPRCKSLSRSPSNQSNRSARKISSGHSDDDASSRGRNKSDSSSSRHHKSSRDSRSPVNDDVKKNSDEENGVNDY